MSPRPLLQRLALGFAARHGLLPDFLASFQACLLPDLEPAPGLDSPDDLGDLLEELRDPERRQAFEALIDGRLRHEGTSALATTQRFTPPWIAGWLVEQGLAAVDGDPAPIFDPACGGGRLLLDAHRALVARGRSPQRALEALVGFDIDPLAADVTAWALWLEVAVTASPPARLPQVAHPGEDVGLGQLGALGAPGALERATSGAIAVGEVGLLVMNPPYMSARHMSAALRGKLRDAFGVFAGDLYTAFLGRGLELVRPGGALAVLCQESFLFLKRDRELRRRLLVQLQLREALHLGPHAFEGIAGEKASVVAFVGRRDDGEGEGEARVVDLTDVPDAAGKRTEWERGAPSRIYTTRWAVRRAARGEPFAYWWPDALRDVLDGRERLGDWVEVPGGPNKTADNARFMRYWWEVPEEEIGARWVRYAKGGPHQKWRGNLERVVDWSPEARGYYASNPTSNLLGEAYWFREGITWSDFGGRAFSARRLPPGCVFDMAGPSLFVDGSPLPLDFWLGLLNSPLVCHLLTADNPTIHYQVSNLRRLPLPPRERLTLDNPQVTTIARLAAEARGVAAALERWDPTSPGREEPLWLTAWRAGGADNLDGLCEQAEALLTRRRAELAALERELGEAVEALYGVARGDVAALDARYRPPAPRSVARSVRALDAVDHALAVSSEAAWGGLWGELVAEVSGRVGLEEKLARHRRWRARKRAVHATRGGSLWG